MALRLAGALGISYLLLIVLHRAYLLIQAKRLIRVAQRFPRSCSLETKADIRIFGDSIAYGVGAEDSRATLFARLKRDYPDREIEDCSRIGGFLAGVSDIFIRHRPRQEVAIVFAGGMDVLFRPKRTYSAHVARMLSLAATHSGKVILFIPSSAGKVPFFPVVLRWFLRKRSLHLAELITEYSAQFNNIEIVDLLAANDTSLKQYEEHYLASDWVHPSSHSYGVWYRTLKKYF